MWRRRLAGDFSSLPTLQRRRRDAGATKNLHFLIDRMDYISSIECNVRNSGYRRAGQFVYCDVPPNPKSLTAFSFKINGRTSSRMPISRKSAIQRSGVISG